MIDYSSLDRPFLLQFIFFPRKDFTLTPKNAFDLFVPVGVDASISCRFYKGGAEWPWILFFHGNGEVVSDYDEISRFYHQKKINLVVADYRGYGASTGTPTLAYLVKDAPIVFTEVKKELFGSNLGKDLWVMGRSLGSIAALELASRFPEEMKGLILESGFPSIVRIMIRLGVPAHIPDREEIDRECLERIKKISLPTLIIHGDQDMLVPVENAKTMYQYVGSVEKELLIIPSATHNDIMFVGLKDYFDALERFIAKTDQASRE